MTSQAVIEIQDLTVVSVGEQGPPGQPGPPGVSGSATAQYVAGEALGGNRCVKLDAAGLAMYASNLDTASLGGFVGVSVGAVGMAELVTVQYYGLMVEPSWSWTPGQLVFLGTNGLLTQVPPSAPAFQLVVGYAPTATSVIIAPRERVILS